MRDRQLGTIERLSVDSSGAQGNSNSRNPSVSSDGRYVAFDSFANNLVADDSNGSTDSFVHERSIIAPNQPPVIQLVNPASTSNEGDTKLYEYTLDNTDGPPATVTPNCGSGELKPGEAGDPPSSFRCYFPDGDTTTTVSVTADDGQSANNTDSDSVGITVSNVAPTATFNSPNSVNQGSAFTLSLTGVSEPSSADSAAGFTYAFDCGDGSGHSAFSATNSRTCPTTTSGTRSVKGKIRDKDGGVREYTDTVTVLPLLTITDARLTEGNSGTKNALFTVRLSAASQQTVTVNYTTANGTAKTPGDYFAKSGMLTFNSDQTTKTISVAVKGDTRDEPNETFTVRLSGATNAAIADATGRGMIIDND